MMISSDTLKQKEFPKIEHGDLVVQLGSCFSANMSFWFRRAGFEVFDNPLGVIFHPVPLAKQILLAFGQAELLEFIQKEDVYVSYDASSTLYSMDSLSLDNELRSQLKALKESLSNAKLLVITWGSAHGYRLIESGKIVANCHQQAKEYFEKELTSADQLFDIWKEAIDAIRHVNPQIQIVFTVSPVRYIRDGLMENSLSKGELFRLVDLLRTQKSHYFPAFELVNDVLRDYRYFEPDGVHPNSLATEFVWEFLRAELFTPETNQIIDELFRIRRMEEHRLLYPESKKAAEYLGMVKQKRESFLSQYPVVVW
ncbi:GSCFA domain-containing protein [Fluviicola sp.]|uniref:GSCFA domain-containing protein n=1 Tax=Fluviicola sp. TaxID=1917219 RepID=UPI0026170209|nr:GSCFA domain-containing protein [Fluviicola sp.]